MNDDSPARSFQIFVSYARNDDVEPVDGDSRGFVTTLLRHLEYHFKSLGPPAPLIWRDKRAIEPSEQFNPTIAAGIEASDVLIVVLSNNWIHRSYCLQELELFERRWASLGMAAVKKRVVVVAKQPLDPTERPELLQGQEGYAFYRLDDDPTKFVEFFGRARLSDDFFDAARALAVDLWNRGRSRSDLKHRNDAPQGQPRAERTIYLARPAPDVRAAHARIVAELRMRGYGVVPDSDIPLDASAPDFISDALARAECSVHLLGKRFGFTPEDAGSPIAKLQLELAGRRAARAAESNGTFRRLIWAPKFLDESSDELDAPGVRDPQAVLRKFGEELPTDKVVGAEIGLFAEFVVQQLEATSPERKIVRNSLAPDARVYLCHSSEDVPYALQLGSVLQRLNIEPLMPALEGDPAEILALHQRELAECDAVILCWANAPDVWLRSHARELRSWRSLGRDKEFAYRGVVAGPPPRQTKSLLLQVPPRSEIDVVLDLTADVAVTPERLGPLVDQAGANA